MFCPNCGNQIPDDSKFCGSCGANLSEVTAEPANSGNQAQAEATVNSGNQPQAADPVNNGNQAQAATTPNNGNQAQATPNSGNQAQAAGASASKPTDEIVQFQKKSNNKKAIGIVAIAAVVLVALIGLMAMISSGGSDNAYVFISDGKYELLTNIKKDESIEIASGKNDTVMASMLSFSPDGKYIYYYTKYDSYAGTGSLCRAEYGKLKENSSKNDKYIEIIATNVALGFTFMNDGSVIYQNGSGTLYRYNGKESEQIAKGVVNYYTDGEKRIAYTTGDYSEGYTLYGVKINAIDDKIKLASNFSYIYNATDLDNIYYTKQEDDYSETLYVVGFEKDSEKLGESVNILSIEDGKIYFTEENGSYLCLYDYVVDDYAEADAGLKEPNLDDYVVPSYSYYYMDSSCNPADYDEIYTSCTNSVAFYRTWYSYRSLEYAAQNDGENQDVYQAFVDKYKSQEDENGYIVVTDEVKADLISLANTCGEGYEGEWMELCYYKEQSGSTYDYDTYYADAEKYYEAEERIERREMLRDSENDFPVRTLYCYGDGKLTTINENVICTRYFNGAIMFNTSEQITDTVDLTNVSWTSSVTDLFNLDYELQNYVVTTDGGNTYQMSASAAESFAEAYDEYYAELYFVDKNVYMGSSYEEGCALSVATITDGHVDDFTLITDDAYLVEADGSTVYYASECYDNDGNTYCDLYIYDGKESTRLAQDVLFRNITLYENGDILAYTGYRSRSGYELTMFNSKGEKTLIGDGITQYVRVDKSTLLYISDEDLYVFNGKSKSLVHTDVEWLWSMDSMDVKYVFGAYDYYY